MRFALTIVAISTLSFAFGFTLRGDLIYGGMFRAQVARVQAFELPILKKRGRK